MIGCHLVAFPKGPEDVVLSVRLGTQNGNGTYQVVGLIVLLLPWEGEGWGYDFYVGDI